MTNLANIIKDLENETGIEYTDKEKTFALNLVKTSNQSEAARASGASPQRAGQTGREMAMRPEIQSLVEAIKDYSTAILSDEFVKAGLLKEALTAKDSRDRREALHLLGKTSGMFKDTVETISKVSDEELIDSIKREFGEDAAKKAKEELDT